MLHVRLSRPSLLGAVVAGLLAPSRGLVCRGWPASASFPGSTLRQTRLVGSNNAVPRFTRGRQERKFLPSPQACSSGGALPNDPANADQTQRRNGRPRQKNASTPPGGVPHKGVHVEDTDGSAARAAPPPASAAAPSPTAVAGREHGGVRGPGRRSAGGGRGREGSSSVGDGGRLRLRPWRNGGKGGYDGRDNDRMSPAEEKWEAQEMEVAAALAAAKRGTGERERLVESEAPVEEFVVRDRRVLVKRDDKMRLAGSGLSGNKARKLYALNKIPDDDFPKLVASHGGVQSNAMVAIAAVVASKKGSTFVYHTKPVPRWLRNNPVGNFARTIALGAEIMEVHPDDYKRIFGGVDGPGPRSRLSGVVADEALFLPQGGADAGAEEGVSMLADDIIDYWDDNGPEGKDLRVVLPAGTGTTALFLARHLAPAGIRVCTVPCAGDGAYLFRQMTKVDRESGSVGIFPEIVEPREKAAFGLPRPELLEVWRELDGLGLFVDLLYAAPTWEVIFSEWDKTGSPLAVSPKVPHESEPQLMYVHCGGLDGVSSQLTRYKHQGLLDEWRLQ